MKKILLAVFVFGAIASGAQPITDTGTLRAYINSQIVTNGTKAITAPKVNRILNGYLNVWPGNNYPLSLSYSGGILTMGRSGLSNLTTTIPVNTLQQTINNGNLLTKNDTIHVGDHDLKFVDAANFYVVNTDGEGEILLDQANQKYQLGSSDYGFIMDRANNIMKIVTNGDDNSIKVDAANNVTTINSSGTDNRIVLDGGGNTTTIKNGGDANKLVLDGGNGNFRITLPDYDGTAQTVTVKNTHLTNNRTRYYADASGNEVISVNGQTANNSGDISLTIPTIASASYVPTLTLSTNVSSGSAATGYYTRIGDIVTFTFSASLNPTSTNGECLIVATLPIAANSLVTLTDVFGSGVYAENAGIGVRSPVIGWINSTTTVQLRFKNVATTTGNMSITVTYPL